MALPVNISALINGEIVESKRLEFKRGWNREPILHSICAFANDFNNCGGGYIILGIEADNGIPIHPDFLIYDHGVVPDKLKNVYHFVRFHVQLKKLCSILI